MYDKLKRNKVMKNEINSDLFCIGKDIKNKFVDCEKEEKMNNEKCVKYTLPDGKSLYVGNEGYCGNEVLYDCTYASPKNGIYNGIYDPIYDDIESQLLFGSALSCGIENKIACQLDEIVDKKRQASGIAQTSEAKSVLASEKDY